MTVTVEWPALLLVMMLGAWMWHAAMVMVVRPCRTLLECPRWDEFRILLRPSMDEARARLGAGGDAGTLATYLLGGRVRGAHEDAQDIWCKHWVSLGRVRALQNVVGGLVDGVHVHMQHDAPALAPAPALDNAEAEAEAERGVAGANVDGRVPGFVLVARFLQAVMPARFAVLGQLLSPPRADAGHGMPAFPQQAGGAPPHPPHLGDGDAPT